MGSGFSACAGSSVVRVIEISSIASHDLNRSGGQHSDSCDSGISVSEGTRRIKARNSVSSLFSPDVDSEDEDGHVGINDNQTSSVRPSSLPVPHIEEYGSRSYVNYVSDSRKHRPRIRTACKPLRHPSHQTPMILDHAIHEEDEEANDGEADDRRYNKPQRPKSAHYRKSRAQTPRSRASRASRARSHVSDMDSGGDSPGDMTSDEGEEEVDSDILSIPDETGSHRLRPDSFAAIVLGSQFHRHRFHGTSISNSSSFNSNDDNDWWPDEDRLSVMSKDRARDSCRSRGSSLSLRCNSRIWPDGRVSKKASERSISSILLTTAIELDPSMTSAAPSPASFAVTNPEITQHILKCLQETEQELRAATLVLCAKRKVTWQDYFHVVTSLRPRFLRLLGDFKMSSGEVLRTLPAECQDVVQLEECLARRLLEMTKTSRSALELSGLVRQHVQDLEDLCERQAALSARPVRPPVMPASRRQALWDDSDVEDDTDSAEEDFPAKAAEKGSPTSESQATRSPDGSTGSRQSSGLTSRPPRASCRSARPPSLASSMSSSRAQSSARRPTTNLSVLSGSKVHTVIENDDDADESFTSPTPRRLLTTTSITSTPATSNASSRCNTSIGGNKSRPDSGIVVSSCSASSSSEATRETDADLSAQTEWIATSLEMLEQILQVRTESHDTIKSLVKAITHGSTSEQLKAHALYRWLASQSMTYYAKCTSAKPNSPTGKLRQLADGKTTYAAIYQELARAAGLKCEKVEGYAKGPDYRPGTAVGGSSSQHTHSWNAVFLGGHYHFLDVGFGALPCKFFVEHFFMTPPDEMRLSHFPRDKRWLLMTQSLSVEDFEGTLKTWPTMFAFNIRPLNMKSVLRSYDGRLSITVLLRNVAVCPQLEYIGPGTPQDAEALAFNIDQEIRNVDNAETFHLNLPEEGTYYFTLMVHDLEEDEDIPAFQYRVEYKDELL